MKSNDLVRDGMDVMDKATQVNVCLEYMETKVRRGVPIAGQLWMVAGGGVSEFRFDLVFWFSCFSSFFP